MQIKKDLISFEKKTIKYNEKHLNIWIDEIIDYSLNEGNLHFFLTINFQKEIKNINELEIKIYEIFNLLNNKIQLLSWYQICWEKNKKENYHLHVILAVRSIIGKNNKIKNNIEFLLRNEFEIDTKIEECNKFLDIKKAYRYVYKEYKKEQNSAIFLISRYYEIFKNLKNLFNISIINLKYENILGIVNTNEKYNTKTIILMWDYYILLNNIYIYNNNLYQKIDNSMISYKELSKIEKLYIDFINVCEYFNSVFPIHFNNFNFVDFIGSNLTNKEEKIKRFVDFTQQKIKPDFNVMEFTDGVYFILFNKFLRKDKFLKNKNLKLEEVLKYKKIQTIKFYSCSFNHISEPKKWLNGLEKVLGFKEYKNTKDKIMGFFQNNEDAKWLLIYIAYIFHFSTNELKKRSTLYIWGASNTGKTTMIINPLINYFGKDNIGLISNNKNFEYQHFLDKKLLILDEFDFNKVNIDNFKKLISGELLLGEKKNKDSYIMDHTPMIISSNKNPNIDYNMLDIDPIKNRLKSIQFKNKLEENQQELDINKQIKNEEAKIIVYCNKVYFNWIKQKGIKTERFKIMD